MYPFSHPPPRLKDRKSLKSDERVLFYLHDPGVV